MPKKTVMILIAVAAVAAVVLWIRRRAEEARPGAAAAYDPPLRPSAGADVANAFRGLTSSVGNWAAQWIDTGVNRAAGALENVIPISQAYKPKANTNTGLPLVTSPQYGQR